MRAQSMTRLRALVAAMLVVTGAGLAADSGPQPFVAALDGHANPVFLDACTIQNTESGTGYARHLGAITWETSETVDACSEPDVALVRGEFTLTGADGAQLTGTYTTVATFDFAGGVVNAAGLYTVTGGTGRFAAATGRGVITADGSLQPPFGVLGGLSGTIDF